MKNTSKTEFRVGITVTLGLLLLVWILSWAKNVSLESQRKNLSVLFNNTSGLEIGDQVTVNGVRKGFVDDIKVLDDKVLVILSLDGDTDLRNDLHLYVDMLDLMGGKKVEIYPGANTEKVEYSKVQKGEFSPDIPAAMKVLGTFQNDIPQLLASVNTTLTELNKVLLDKELSGQIHQTMQNLSLISNDLRVMIKENSSGIKSLVQNTNDLAVESKEFLKKNESNISGTVTDIKSLVGKSEILISKLDLFLQQTNDKQNNIGKFINDEKFYQDLKDTFNQVKELVTLINDQLKNEGVNVKAKLKIF